MKDDATAGIGDNNPPPYSQEELDALQAKLTECADAGGDWVKLGAIENAEQSTKLNDFIAGCRKLKTSIDNTRRTDKAPHFEAGKAVDAAYKPLISGVEKVMTTVGPMQGVWLRKEQLRLDDIKRQEEAKAADDLRKAQELERQAEARGDLLGASDAQEQAEAAEKAATQAAKPVKARAGSATGGGKAMSLRKIKTVEVTNVRLLFMHFQEHPEIKEALGSLAQRTVRAAGYDEKANPIPGIKITIEEKAV